MNVVIISFQGRGGMLQYTINMANSLSRKTNVTVVLPDYSDIRNFDSRVNIIPVQAPSNVVKTLFLSINILYLSRIVHAVNRLNPDVVHIVNSHPWNTLICIFCKKNSKFFFTLHDPVPHEQSLVNGLLQHVKNVTNNITIKRSNGLIVHGNTLKKVCVKGGIPEEKLFIIPLGALGDHSLHKAAIGGIDRKGFPANKKYVLFFGRIEPYKGLEYLIEAAEIVYKEVDNICFIIAGDGNFKNYQHLSNNGLFKIINRYITDDEVVQFFMVADIVVLPYISASQSGVIPIAYAYKKPVIASNVGAIPDVVEDGITGVLVPPKDYISLSESIIKLITDEDLCKKIGDAGYHKLNIEMSWDQISEKIIQIYKDVIAMDER